MSASELREFTQLDKTVNLVNSRSSDAEVAHGSYATWFEMVSMFFSGFLYKENPNGCWGAVKAITSQTTFSSQCNEINR